MPATAEDDGLSEFVKLKAGLAENVIQIRHILHEDALSLVPTW